MTLAREKKSIVKKTKKHGIPMDSVIYFGSGMKAPYNMLSNFNKCIIKGKIWVMVEFNKYELREYTFPSSEHYWWAHFLLRDVDIKRLSIGGDLSTLETGLPLFYKEDELKNKIQYWSKKNNVGIVTKILAGKLGTQKRKRAHDIGIRMSIHPSEKYGPQGHDSTLNKIWSKILVAKYTQNKIHRDVLVKTREESLVEFTRCPEDRVDNEFWAGRVIDGKLYGKNYMGDCMMSIRDALDII